LDGPPVKRPRLHLVYPEGPGIGCPETIGRHLAAGLASRYEVVTHRWDSREALPASPEDLLLGHPHPAPGTVFRRAAAQGGWRRVVMLCPFNGDPAQVAWLDPVLERCDAYLALCGEHWERALPSTSMRRWTPRLRRLDLALDRAEFPRVKRSFAAPGKRRFLYVGHSGWPKNTGYLSAIARALPDVEFAWAGSPRAGAIEGVRHLGRLDFSLAASRAVVAEFDFMITVGSFDANPATVLEAMGWGLIPVCTPQSGYLSGGEPGVVNVPLDDLDGAVSVLRGLQALPSARLRAMAEKNRRRLERHYTWKRFTADVKAALEGKGRPALPSEGRTALRLRALVGRFSPLHPRWLAASLLSRWRA
jgi:hypothetical protein